MSQPYEGDSTSATVPGIKGTNTAPAAGGPGVFGESQHGEGIHGVSHGQAAGVSGFNDAPDGAAQPGVFGESQHFEGVHGVAHNKGAGVAGFNLGPKGAAAHGVWGESQHWEGVHGIGHGEGAGVAGFNDAPEGIAQPGVWGESQHWEGVHRIGHGKGAGVAGFNDGPDGVAQPGVWGESQHWEGVHGVAHNKGAGVAGFNLGPSGAAAHGIWGESQNWEGVHGIGHGQGAGVAGFNDAPQGSAQPGIWGESQNGEGVHGVTHSPSAAAIAGFATAGGNAGYFQGNVTVTGDVLLTGADCAEEFDIDAEGVAPGTVMVLSNHQGSLRPCQHAYDKKIAGVISGAGDYKPGITLDKRQSRDNRMPVALVGKVYCKADANGSPIEIGDLLTTSSRPGHAMKAVDPNCAFGAVLGKALAGLQTGTGLIPVLVALQ